ncbi:MAG TPA: hypothetical protein VFP72_10055 [Kineosporiaceae bacterium]|nr:hypothetical protein [Kineosporiaceae bacterium]
MGLFRRRGTSGTATRAQHREEVAQIAAHLAQFVRTRRGVEAYLEPATTVTPPTVLLIASTGEWTRRRLIDPSLLRGLAEDLHVPVYDARLVGYPQRMRDWNSRMRRERPQA